MEPNVLAIRMPDGEYRYWEIELVQCWSPAADAPHDGWLWKRFIAKGPPGLMPVTIVDDKTFPP